MGIIYKKKKPNQTKKTLKATLAQSDVCDLKKKKLFLE